jgi:hypothetical protein
MTVGKPPEPGAPPTFADAAVALAGQRQRLRQGLSGSIMTSGQGDISSAPLAAKSLLGQ